MKGSGLEGWLKTGVLTKQHICGQKTINIYIYILYIQYTRT